jgi:membrane protease YdiL (CAAX protease family)
MREKIAQYLSLGVLMVSAVLIIPLEQKVGGYPLLLAGALLLYFAEEQFAKHVLLVFVSIAILGLAPISTDISASHVAVMGGLLSLAVAVPYLVTRYIYKQKVIKFPFAKHTWTKEHVGYLLLALGLSYVLLPFWMQTTNGWQNWSVILEPWPLFVLFLGTNGLGIWDELFFIVTILALLKKHLPFWQANTVQAVLFTAFLFELGFRGWAPLLIFPFALLQGLVFKRTENLLYIIAIHLTIDLILYLALINAHFPEVLPIFLTR